MDNLRFFIIGSNGLLGQKLVKLFNDKKIPYLATSKGENRNPECNTNHFLSLDITDHKAVKEVVSEYQPHIIVNTAAMTNVDGCEKNKEACYDLNVKAVQNLIKVAENLDAHLIHYSTDFIFDGEKGEYSEEDEPNPLSVYGQSKLDSEKEIIDSGFENYTIIRTTVVYGVGHDLTNGNIFIWAKEQLEKGNQLTIVEDQFRAPTYAVDLAEATFHLAQEKAFGIYHVSGSETLSMYQIIVRLAKWMNVDQGLVKAISTKDLNQLAPRPSNTGFNLSKVRQKITYNPHSLEESFDSMWR